VSSAYPDLADVILFGAYTGMRSGEVLKLKPEDIDLTNNIIMVGGTDSTRTKGRNYRVVPIHARIHSMIERRINKTLLFGEDFYKDLICRHFRSLLTDCGYSKLYSYHVLRHSFATWANTKGVPIRTIQELLGHACITTTEGYVKVTNEAKSNAIMAL
jgi:integrase